MYALYTRYVIRYTDTCTASYVYNNIRAIRMHDRSGYGEKVKKRKIPQTAVSVLALLMVQSILYVSVPEGRTFFTNFIFDRAARLNGL